MGVHFVVDIGVGGHEKMKSHIQFWDRVEGVFIIINFGD